MAISRNIQKELNDISQTVANLDGSTPFVLPPDYFSQFPEKLIQIIENEESKKAEPNFSELLGSLQKKNPLVVPPGYFNAFNIDVPGSAPNVFSLQPRKWIAYAAAACIGGLIFGLIYLSSQQPKQLTLASQTISSKTIESFLNENEALDESFKEMEFSADELAFMDVSASTISELLKDIPDTDISGFLDQQGSDESKSMY
ncbi:MAG: hypothetical protein FJX88_05200 [Bacteroidetes bacterium]|nr:hypothetical protein [Bacteroidota bacterium]